eukprot:c13174_g1_i1 orf=123-749(+)
MGCSSPPPVLAICTSLPSLPACPPLPLLSLPSIALPLARLHIYSRPPHITRLPTARFSRSSLYTTPRQEQQQQQEEIFFDGGTHYGDLLTNLIFGFSLLWLPLTVAAVFRALFLRYRFTSLRVTVISGLNVGDCKDFSYSAIKDVQSVPRFIGVWGDMVITLTDGTKVEIKSIPKFREISKYCLDKAGKAEEKGGAVTVGRGPKGFSS